MVDGANKVEEDEWKQWEKKRMNKQIVVEFHQAPIQWHVVHCICYTLTILDTILTQGVETIIILDFSILYQNIRYTKFSNYL